MTPHQNTSSLLYSGGEKFREWNQIKSLNLQITNTCNLKCTICDIWQNKEKKSLNIDNIKNIISSKHITQNTDITLTWWETLLHKDIENIFQTIHSHWLQVNTLSTNWTLYTKLKKLLTHLKQNNIPSPNIHISIDWLEEKHDKQRWIPWSFKKSLETIMKLKKQNYQIKIKYTINKHNIWDIKKVFLLSQKLWVDLWLKIIENDTNYTNTRWEIELLNDKEKNEIIKTLSEIYKNKNKYINNLLYYIKTNKLNFECQTPLDNLFIMTNWEVFTCTKYDSIWNICSDNLDDIFHNEKHQKIIETVEKEKCNKCFSPHGAWKGITQPSKKIQK